MNIRPLTPLMSDVYAFMVDFFKENDQLPPVHVIADKFDRYPNQLVEMQFAFEKRGLIEKNEVGKWRFSRDKA